MRTLSCFIILAKNRLRSEYHTYFFHHGNTGFILMSNRKQCKLNSMMNLKYPTVAASSSNKSPVNTSSSKKEQNEAKKEEFEFFFGNTFIFSQFHPAKFTLDGITYSCMEQYMHHQKALTFNDTVRAYQILRETDPKCHKKLGRQVQPFDKVIWGRKCVAVVRKGSLAKYRQNLEMKKALFATYPKTLVEANPRDRLWGIGLGRNNPKAQDRSTWRGKNLLGDTLTEVRNKMMAEEELIPGSNTSGPSSIQRTPVEHDNKIQTLTTEEKLSQAKDVHVSSVPNKIVSTTKTSYKDDISSSKGHSSSEGIKKNTSDSIKTPRKEETLKSSQKSKSQHRESPLKDKYSDKNKTKSDGKEITIQESTSKNKSSSTKKRKWRSDDQKTESEDKGGSSSSKKRKIIFEEQKTQSEDKQHLMSKEEKGISGEQKTPTKHEEHSKERKERSRDKRTPSKRSGELTASQEMKETSREHKSSSKHSGKHSLSKEKEKSKEKKKSSKNEGELSVSMEKKKSREQAKLGEKERREISKDQQTSERDKREHSSSNKANRRTKEQETPSESMSVDDGNFLLTEKMKEEHDMNLVGSEEEHLSSDLNSVSKNEQQAPLKIEKVQSKEENLPASVEGQEVLKSEETLAEDDDNTSVKKTDEDIQSSSHKKPPEDKCLMLYEKMADSSDNKDIDLKEKEKSPLVPETTKEEMSMAVLSEDQYSLIPGQSVDEENPVKNVNMDKPSEIKNTNSSLHAEENKACVSEDIPSVEGQSCLSRKRPVEEDSEYSDKLQSEDSSKTLKQRKITHFIIQKTVCSDNK